MYVSICHHIVCMYIYMSTYIQVRAEALRAEADEGAAARAAALASASEGARHSAAGRGEWDWVRKKLAGGSSGRASQYASWFGAFLQTAALGKRWALWVGVGGWGYIYIYIYIYVYIYIYTYI